MSEWLRNGQVGEPPTWEDASRAEGWTNFIRASVQFLSPISISFDPVTRAAMDYYSKLVDQNQGDYSKADIAFKKEFGNDGFALLGSTRKNVAGLSSSLDDIAIIRKNKDLLTKIGRTDMKYANMLSTGYGEELTDKYSTVVASIYKYLNYPGKTSTPITVRKTDDEVQREVESKLGWIEYNNINDLRSARMYEYGITSTYDPRYVTSGIEDDFKAQEEEIAKKFPGWQSTRQDNQKNFWLEVFPVVKEIANNPSWRKEADKKSDKWKDIDLWVKEAEELRRGYDAADATDAMKFDMAATFSQFHFDFLQNASDEFSTFATRYLNSMPQLDPSLVIRRTK
jgi:hypothetical protein